jgi:hypothetical protein
MIEEAKVELRLENGKINFNDSIICVLKYIKPMILISKKDRNYK